jgi:predicted ATPase/DNA-binding CsgD family transcriptional regulator
MAGAGRLASLSNLPAPRTSFIGRRRELTEVRQGLARSRLLTLTGAGGAGKTRLALHASVTLDRAFPDGVRLVELAQISEGPQVGQAVAAGLGLSDVPARRLPQVLTEHLSTRHLLLILDNCEHVLDACGELVDMLLAACPQLHVLATSRQPLGIAGETILHVPSLPCPEPGLAVSSSELVAYDAVRLLVERAQAVVPGFEVTAANASALAEVCRRLDGLPLALELAAARLKALTVEQLLQRLDDRFRLLRVGNRAAPARHQALRTAIDWSHDLLSHPERVLARRLAVFPGDFDLEAVEAICAGGEVPDEDTLDLLASLVERSLVSATPAGSRMRYRLPETIRQYFGERLSEAREEAGLKQRHLGWYADLAAAADSEWLGPRQGEWLDRLEGEHDNLRAALDAEQSGDDHVVQLVMATNLWLYWYARGRMSEGRRVLEHLLSAPGPAGGDRARATSKLGYLTLAQGDVEAGACRAEEALKMLDRAGGPRLRGELLAIAGLAARARRDPRLAAQLFGESRDAYRQVDEPAGVAVAISGLAGAVLDQGDLTGARTLQLESAAIKRDIGDDWNLAFSLFDLAIIAVRGGDLAAARDLLSETLGLRRRLDDRRGVAMTVEAQAWVEVAAGEHRRAARLLGAAGALWAAIPAQIGGMWLPEERAREAVCRQALGDAEMERLLAEGAAMAHDVVVSTAEIPAEVAVQPSPLTRREEQVAVLVAAGLSNKEIAGRLAIAQRTAETHVENLLAKLGFVSRTQIAAWVGMHGLTT